MKQTVMEFSTSREAYDKFKANGNEDKHEAFIVKALEKGNMTAYEIGKETGLTSTQVSRRTIKLERMDLIVRTGERRKDKDGSRRMVYSLKGN